MGFPCGKEFDSLLQAGAIARQEETCLDADHGSTSSVPGPGALHARPHVRHEGATKGNVEGLKRGNGANARAESASILDATVSMAPTFVSRKMFIQLIYWPSGLV